MTDWNEIRQKADIADGYIVAMFTDRVIVDRYPMAPRTEEEFSGNIGKLLDARIFDKNAEHRFFRGSIGRPLIYRRRDDTEDHIVRTQLFDIDKARSAESFAKDGTVSAIGGGQYHLPLPDMEGAEIILHEYLRYDNAGLAQVYDWRLVDFKKGEQ